MRLLCALLLFVPAVALADGVERRLHPDRVDASSFLWNDWNKFQENYHPLYVADDDPKTAWVEGAEGVGKGEWIRVAVTALDGTTQVRLRLRNGYQKSKALFKANARLKEIEIRLGPGGARKAVTLEDADGWQEVVVPQPSGKLDGVELKVVSVYEGTKYEDLCLSDLQIFATSTTRENPAFEKSKLDKLLAWKAERVKAAKQFQAAEGKEPLPVLPAYRWESQDDDVVAAAGNNCGRNHHCWVAVAAQILAKKDPALVEKHKAALAIATLGMNSPEDFVPAQLAPKNDVGLPVVDGLHEPTMYDRFEGVVGYAGLEIPIPGTVASLRADRLGAFEVKGGASLSEITGASAKTCRSSAEKVHTWMLKEKAGGKDRVRAMIYAMCGKFETRDGEETAGMMQVAVYDDDGRLEVLAGEGYVNVFTWKGNQLVAGKGIFFDGRIGELGGPEVAKAP